MSILAAPACLLDAVGAARDREWPNVEVPGDERDTACDGMRRLGLILIAPIPFRGRVPVLAASLANRVGAIAGSEGWAPAFTRAAYRAWFLQLPSVPSTIVPVFVCPSAASDPKIVNTKFNKALKLLVPETLYPDTQEFAVTHYIFCKGSTDAWCRAPIRRHPSPSARQRPAAR